MAAPAGGGFGHATHAKLKITESDWPRASQKAFKPRYTVVVATTASAWQGGLSSERFYPIQTRLPAPQNQKNPATEGQEYLFTEYRDRFVITGIPRSHVNPAEVFCFACGRCDQENIIAQFKNGIAARITYGGRRAKVYLAGSHRFADHLVIAAQRLHTFASR